MGVRSLRLDHSRLPYAHGKGWRRVWTKEDLHGGPHHLHNRLLPRWTCSFTFGSHYFRAVQGIGAAMTTVTAFAILIGLYPEGKARNRAFGIITAILSGGFAAGAVAGGVLSGSFGWGSGLFFHAPVGLVGVLFCLKELSKKGWWAPNPQIEMA